MLIDEAIDANADDYQKFLVSWLQAAMVFGIAWGIGGILDEESRRQFDQFHKKVTSAVEFKIFRLIFHEAWKEFNFLPILFFF